jgi:hypothetical protein
MYKNKFDYRLKPNPEVILKIDRHEREKRRQKKKIMNALTGTVYSSNYKHVDNNDVQII